MVITKHTGWAQKISKIRIFPDIVRLSVRRLQRDSASGRCSPLPRNPYIRDAQTLPPEVADQIRALRDGWSG
jgi:hypothetical protein